MYQLIIIIHVLLGMAMIGLIMIQQGKGADAGASFSGTSGSVFGAQGAGTFLTRTTATLATLFFMTSLGLSIINSRQTTTHDLMDSSSNVAPKQVDVPEADKIPETVIPSAIESGNNPPSTNSNPAAIPSDTTQINQELIKKLQEQAEGKQNEPQASTDSGASSLTNSRPTDTKVQETEQQKPSSGPIESVTPSIATKTKSASKPDKPSVAKKSDKKKQTDKKEPVTKSTQKSVKKDTDKKH